MRDRQATPRGPRSPGPKREREDRSPRSSGERPQAAERSRPPMRVEPAKVDHSHAAMFGMHSLVNPKLSGGYEPEKSYWAVGLQPVEGELSIGSSSEIS